MDYIKYPEMRRSILAVSEIYEAAGTNAVEMIKTRPVSFAAVAVAEVLARWQWRGMPCSQARNPVRPPEEKAMLLTKK